MYTKSIPHRSWNACNAAGSACCWTCVSVAASAAPRHAWANAQRLQASLADAGIAYQHRPELAPTTELRQLQYAEDARQGVGKRTRRERVCPPLRRRWVTSQSQQRLVDGACLLRPSPDVSWRAFQQHDLRPRGP